LVGGSVGAGLPGLVAWCVRELAGGEVSRPKVKCEFSWVDRGVNDEVGLDYL
jgi:hypothetical protein